MGTKMDSTEVYDLLILVDSTYSMEDYLTSLRLSLLRIIPISTLTDCFSHIGILAYKDYCDKDLLTWSGWLTPSAASDEEAVDLLQMVKSLQPFGGGDGPEATKTGLARAYELMREDATTIIFLYTDAAPHTFANGSVDDRDSCLGPELSALKIDTSFGGFGPLFHDWVSAANTLCGRTGKKKAQVFCFLDGGATFGDVARYYLYLCSITGGACFLLGSKVPTNISKVTIEVLLAWMGAEKSGVFEYTTLPASLAMYNSVKDITELKNETAPAAAHFFSTPGATRAQGDAGVTTYQLSLGVLKEHLPKKTTAVQPFAERYAADDHYKILAENNLRRIIVDDVAAISYNPVFGSLWRAICNDRDNEAREELIQAFGLAIDRITDADEKARMKAWLEESYDYTAELLETINSVSVEQQFPCVCLDPTLVFVAATTDDDDDNGNDQNNDKEITSFRRDELLDIGRSCDYKVLRRLGRVLTRLTYINSMDEMPTHITKATDTPRIPLALATADHGRKFWKILLHLVVPGTKLSARPAALLAALSIRLGIKPLLKAATTEMLLWKDRWNNLDIPETWSVGCLSLLLDADREYRRLEGAGKGSEHDQRNLKTLLLPHDRELFERLVSYKMLELNMRTTLTARVGWTPAKTTVPLGPCVVCKTCEFPRSVTIMGADGECGLCIYSIYESEEGHEYRQKNVSKDDSETTPIAWVECSVRDCRAQYVVYDAQSLNVRPKCYYCRSSFCDKEAPTVECSVCLSRMIWPIEYRADNMADYKCHVCESGHKTIVEVDTTASALSKENTNSWLIRNEGKITDAFNGRSLYHTISTCGVEDFCEAVELFPAFRENLTLAGKLVRNLPDVVQQLQHWVSGRRTELGTCSLCFTSKRKTDLMLACGRRGCSQRVCRGCLEGWYGLNAPGRIINTAALFCAFCRRAPKAQTLASYGMGIHAVRNIQAAVDERGTWIYGWCHRCGLASRLMERVCAAGAPPDERDWLCDHCHEMVAEWQSKAELDVKECPGCGTMTEKTRGCNHISCNCGVDWCFLCGGNFKARDIYLHMSEDHGGWYGDGQEYDSRDEDDEDDDDD